MSRKPTIEQRAEAQSNPGKLITELLSAGLSYEMIAVKMGEFLAGAHPSVQSLRRWKQGETVPSRANGAALALLYAQEGQGEEE
jgi:hypothetical protein